MTRSFYPLMRGQLEDRETPALDAEPQGGAAFGDPAQSPNRMNTTGRLPPRRPGVVRVQAPARLDGREVLPVGAMAGAALTGGHPLRIRLLVALAIAAGVVAVVRQQARGEA